MKKVVYFDVEWANSKNKSICQIGIICENFETKTNVYPEVNLLINPNDDFDQYCVAVHGITKETVKYEDSFDIVWPKIEKYFSNAVVIGHNVKSADLDALVKNLNRYNFDIPEMYYLDTYTLAKKYVPYYKTENYKLSTLCALFDIEQTKSHDAFDDAKSCSILLENLIKKYNICIDEHIQKHISTSESSYSPYVCTPSLRREINQLYGIVDAIGMDNYISQEETEYIKLWKESHSYYRGCEEINPILDCLDLILEDNIITLDELLALKNSLFQYVNNLEGSKETLATQRLQGILEGILSDGIISKEELISLQAWLIENSFLEGHYPYDILIKKVKNFLADGVVSNKEEDELKVIFNSLNNPVEELKKQLIIFENKEFCLSGTFEHGSKIDVEKYIVSRGGIIHNSVRKKTNYVVVGKLGNSSYTNGNFGSKVKKAIEFNIDVVTEENIYSI